MNFYRELPKNYEVNIQLLHPNADIPTYATDGSGAFDLYAATARIVAGNIVEYDLGFAVELPPDYSMFIFSRSGQGFKHQHRLTNCVGVIDSDYRGSVKVQIIADQITPTERGGHFISNPISMDLTKAVAQGVILHTPKIKFNVVSKLSDTQRGTGGFGSTDNKGNV